MVDGQAGTEAAETDGQQTCGDAGALIDARIAALGDWRGATLTAIRRLIREADPAVVEAVGWRKPSNPLGVPVWSHAGVLCTGETYRDKVKLTFARGAALPDPSGLFNAGLGGGTRRAIDLRAGDLPDETAFKALIASAVALNTGRPRAAPRPSRPSPSGPGPGRDGPPPSKRRAGGPSGRRTSDPSDLGEAE